MSNKRGLVKFAMVAPLAGQTVDILADLGNCYRIINGHNRLSKANIQLYLDNASLNINKFDKDSQPVYSTDLSVLKLAVNSFESDTIAFGELCRAFFKLKYDTLTSPSVEEKFRSAVKKRLGVSPIINFKEEDKKWKDAILKHHGIN